MNAVLAFAAPILVGLLVVDVLVRGRAPCLSEGVLRCVTGIAIGAGLASVAHSALLLFSGSPETARGGAKGVAFAGIALVALLALLARRRAKPRAALETPSQEALPRAAAVAVAVACLASLFVFLRRTNHMPDGEFDAFAIWNMRGRMLLRGGGDPGLVFSPLMPASHPDYPLMLPGLSAAGWLYAGEDAWWVPAAQALSWLVLLLAALGAILARLAGARAACFGILILLAAPAVVRISSQQYADVPLSALLLLALSWLALAYRGPREEAGRALALSGACVSLAVWTKNEGLAHAVALAAVTAAIPVEGVSRARALRCFALGAAPLLLVGLAFRALVAPANDLVEGARQGGALARLVDGSRYAEIARAFALEILRVSPWTLMIPLLLLFSAFNRRRDASQSRRAVGSALLLVALAYAGVYVLTPRPLRWHLETSLARLLLQAYPALVFWTVAWGAAPRPACEPVS